MLNQAIAKQEVTTEVSTNLSSNTVVDKEYVLDEYGRDAAERTVELTSHDAEFIDREVTAGEHQTYESALTYVLSRGFAEISRARKAAEALREARKMQEQSKLYSEMLKVNPALVTDPQFVAKMIAALGVKA